MRTTTLLTAARFAKEGEAFAPVALPHTWNAKDGQDGGNDYWRGVGTFWLPYVEQRSLPWRVRALWIRNMTCPQQLRKLRFI